MKASEWKTGASLSFDSGRIAPEKRLSEDTLRDSVANGTTYMEVSLTPEALDKTYFPKYPEMYGEYCIRAGATPWSFHLPFSQEIDISRTEYQGKESVELDKKYILLAARAGIKVAVVHPSSEPISDADRAKRLKTSRSALRELAEYAESYGIHLAVEDLPRTCLGRTSADILYLLENNPALSVCFDTNHLLMEDNLTFIKNIGSKIVMLHVSDYDFIDERHLLPLKGKNDWKAILAALENVGYRGPFLYEVSGKDETLTHASFRENHMALCAL